MKNTILLLGFLSLNVFSGDLPTAKFVDVKKYTGKWYAIGALPQFFTRKCVAQTAEYKVKSSEEISVLNTCIKKKNKIKTIDGQAKIVNKSTNAELEVSFNSFWTRLFRVKGDYVIMELDSNYKYVLVGNYSRKGLWIMSRTPNMPKTIYKKYLKIAEENGFNINKVIRSRF